MGNITYYPTGVNIYKPEKCWNGYTLYTLPDDGAILMDMHGREVHRWNGIAGFPLKMLPGGRIMASTKELDNGLQDMEDLVQVDWNGNIEWKFNTFDTWPTSDKNTRPVLRQHHDFQREGNPVGYYAGPELLSKTDSGKTLILCHENVNNPKISEKPLLDDTLIEVDWNGNILWKWKAEDHYEEFGFCDEEKQAIYHWPNFEPRLGVGDWFHMNCASYVGPNHWYDEGDLRFHPENIIFGSREGCVLCIISRETGHVVWRLGPDFSKSEALQKIGWIIGQHHVHIIPKGLPGAGNLLLFDNGGAAGYAAPTRQNPTGNKAYQRDYSRVLEINPVTLTVEWQYSAAEAGFFAPIEPFRFYSKLVSSAQRLPNGNTVITEGVDGRIFEVTKAHELVWEYTNPYFTDDRGGSAFRPPKMNMIYRSYRVPYEWVPQLTPPDDLTPILPPDISTFRVPGAPVSRETKAVTV